MIELYKKYYKYYQNIQQVRQHKRVQKTRAFGLSKKKRKKMHKAVALLPNDIWNCIFEYCALPELAHVTLVNKQFAQICSNDHVWQSIATNVFGMPKNLSKYREKIAEFFSYRFEHPEKPNGFKYSNVRTHLDFNTDQWHTARCLKPIVPGGGLYRIGFSIVKLVPSHNSWHIVFGLIPISFELIHRVPGTNKDNSHSMCCTSATYNNSSFDGNKVFAPCYDGCVYGMELNWHDAHKNANLRLFQDGVCEYESEALLSNTEYRFSISLVREQSAKLVPWCRVVSETQ